MGTTDPTPRDVAAADRPPSDVQPSGKGPTAGRRGRRVVALAVVAIAVLALVGVGAAVMWRRQAERERRAAEDRAAVARAAARKAAARGQAVGEAGRPDRAQLWLAEALRLAPAGDEALGRALRHDLAAWAARSPSLRAVVAVRGVPLAFRPDGKVLLVATEAGAQLVDPATGQPLGPEMPQPGAVAAAFEPDGAAFWIGDRDGSVRRRSAADGKPLGSARSVPGKVLGFEPGGRVVATLVDAAIQLRDPANGAAVGAPIPRAGDATALAFSPDGATLAVGDKDGVRLVGVADGAAVGRLMALPKPATAAAFSPDGLLVLTGGEDGEARLWDAATGAPIGPPLHHPWPIRAALFDPNGDAVLVAGEGVEARTWDVVALGAGAQLMPHRLIRPEGPNKSPLAVALRPDGEVVLTGGDDGTARLWEAASGRPIGHPLEHGFFVQAVGFSPDGRVAATGGGDGSLRLWNPGNGEPIGRPGWNAGPITSLAFSPDGRLVLVGCADGNARFFDATVGYQAAGRPMFHGDGRAASSVWTVGYGPDGRTVATAASDGAIRLWRPPGTQALGPPLKRRGPVFAYSPDGKLLLTGGEAGAAGVTLWDLETQSPARTLAPEASAPPPSRPTARRC
ncbi:MAG TPA: WD40 repeat domain-containing protein [Isosphaeraceae bacterium]|nr:WD40 repeat domain-containing protein [Isosphaeraceae bacterium]